MFFRAVFCIPTSEKQASRLLSRMDDFSKSLPSDVNLTTKSSVLTEKHKKAIWQFWSENGTIHKTYLFVLTSKNQISNRVSISFKDAAFPITAQLSDQDMDFPGFIWFSLVHAPNHSIIVYRLIQQVRTGIKIGISSQKKDQPLIISFVSSDPIPTNAVSDIELSLEGDGRLVVFASHQI